MRKEAVSAAIQDVVDGVRACRIWLLLSWLDLKMRYRRSTLGPFWISVNLAVMVVTIGILYSIIFRMEYSEYVPYFAAGIVGWTLIASILTESTTAFIVSESLIKQAKMPLCIHICRIISRNCIIFLHNFLVLLICMFVFPKYFQWRLLFLPISLLWLSVIFFLLCLFVSIFSTRYRDVPQLIANILQIAMFFTPIIWNIAIIPFEFRWLVLLNPFYHLVELIRAPILGLPVDFFSLCFCGALTLVLSIVVIPFYAHYRPRIVYWL